jgi:hypothetical protein
MTDCSSTGILAWMFEDVNVVIDRTKFLFIDKDDSMDEEWVVE